jgi:natural product biosynthesis luciferase-like monooxygenase protein
MKVMIENILLMCAEQNVNVNLEDGMLEVLFDDTPSDELIDLLRAHKKDIIEYLSSNKSIVNLVPLKATNESTGPLSFGQQRMWFIDRLERSSEHYNMPMALDLKGQLDKDALIHSLNEIVRRHQVLRTSYEMGGATQVVNEHAEFVLTELSLFGLEDQISKIDDFILTEQKKPFSLLSDLMIRGSIIQLANEHHVLLLTLHHIACDGWSLGILVEELKTLYTDYVNGSNNTLGDLPIQYIDYAYWQRENKESFEQELGFWSAHLARAPRTHSLRCDYPRPVNQSFSGDNVTMHLNPQDLLNIKDFCKKHDVTPYMFCYSVFALLISKLSNEIDVVIGTPIANRQYSIIESLVGYFANTLTLRSQIDSTRSFTDFLISSKEMVLGVFENQNVPFDMVVNRIQPERNLSHSPLFQIMFSFHSHAQIELKLPNLLLKDVTPKPKSVKTDLELSVTEIGNSYVMDWNFSTSLFSKESIDRFSQCYEVLLRQVLKDPSCAIREYAVVPNVDQIKLKQWGTSDSIQTENFVQNIHQLIEFVANEKPDSVALRTSSETLSYRELDDRANKIAHYLIEQGVVADQVIGLKTSRSTSLVIGMLGILKAGAAYLPLEQEYPKSRLDYMINDSDVKITLTDATIKDILSENYSSQKIGLPHVEKSQLAYVIYTSGSTGNPKGVKVTHNNLIHFVTAMHPYLKDGGKWLAVTGISFDISVLELLGSLSNGFEVVLYSNFQQEDSIGLRNKTDFSLFYFAAGGCNKKDNIYNLLIEGAKFADNNKFAAIWTPERHFNEFGGIYPAPEIIGAALSTITKNISIRAGSCVLPLNNPIALAEKWSVVDNLSNGRTAMAFASGWHPDDFVLAPDNFTARHAVMYESIKKFNQLWSGESVSLTNGIGKDVDVRLFPRPIQEKMPHWLTIAGDPNAFVKAGELGMNVLTHILRQSIGELEKNIQAYRKAWTAAGHHGNGTVSLMIHTYLGESTDAALETVYEPFSQYLLSALNLSGNGANDNGSGILSDEITRAAFGRYSKTAALFGNVEHCTGLAEKFIDAGVDEIACLIDFGVESELVIDSFPRIKSMMDKVHERQLGKVVQKQDIQVNELIRKYDITHLQCTPSFALMHLMNDEGLNKLSHIFIGGEAMPAILVEKLKEFPSLIAMNMYGPTEATVWASSHTLKYSDSIPPIGKPLPGYSIKIVDKDRNEQPINIPGELIIGGPGVTQGYLNRAELTEEKFVSLSGSDKWYFTGDKAMWNEHGALEFLGRIDSQIKLRGHRIEPNEIAIQICQVLGVQNAVVVLDEHPAGARLAAYIESAGTLDKDALVESVKQHLGSVLPTFMLPSAYMILAQLPMTLNGKVNKNALPKIDIAQSTGPFVTASTETEKLLLKMWSDLLAISDEQISCDVSFFDLGGHSLLLTKMVSQVMVREIFEHPTIISLAEFLQSKIDLGVKKNLLFKATSVEASQTEEFVL